MPAITKSAAPTLFIMVAVLKERLARVMMWKMIIPRNVASKTMAVPLVRSPIATAVSITMEFLQLIPFWMLMIPPHVKRKNVGIRIAS